MPDVLVYLLQLFRTSLEPLSYPIAFRQLSVVLQGVVSRMLHSALPLSAALKRCSACTNVPLDSPCAQIRGREEGDLGRGGTVCVPLVHKSLISSAAESNGVHLKAS